MRNCHVFHTSISDINRYCFRCKARLNLWPGFEQLSFLSLLLPPLPHFQPPLHTSWRLTEFKPKSTSLRSYKALHPTTGNRTSITSHGTDNLTSDNSNSSFDISTSASHLSYHFSLFFFLHFNKKKIIIFFKHSEFSFKIIILSKIIKFWLNLKFLYLFSYSVTLNKLK